MALKSLSLGFDGSGRPLRLEAEDRRTHNPDGAEVPCPHLHIYREGFGDKWAIPAPVDPYTDTLDVLSTLVAFLVHCNVADPPKIQEVLF